MRVLVLGGTTFIGRRVVERLHERGDRVLVVHRGHHEPAPWFAGLRANRCEAPVPLTEDSELRRVRAGRRRMPIGAGNLLWTRAHVEDIATGVADGPGHPGRRRTGREPG